MPPIDALKKALSDRSQKVKILAADLIAKNLITDTETIGALVRTIYTSLRKQEGTQRGRNIQVARACADCIYHLALVTADQTAILAWEELKRNLPHSFFD